MSLKMLTQREQQQQQQAAAAAAAVEAQLSTQSSHQRQQRSHPDRDDGCEQQQQQQRQQRQEQQQQLRGAGASGKGGSMPGVINDASRLLAKTAKPDAGSSAPVAVMGGGSCSQLPSVNAGAAAGSSSDCSQQQQQQQQYMRAGSFGSSAPRGVVGAHPGSCNRSNGTAESGTVELEEMRCLQYVALKDHADEEDDS
jgi:hypothetical protein